MSTGHGAPAEVTLEVVIDSTVIGIHKPEPAIFSLALHAIDEPPDACVCVGDSLYLDVRPAQAAGLRAIHFDPMRLCRLPDDHDHVTTWLDCPHHLEVHRP